MHKKTYRVKHTKKSRIVQVTLTTVIMVFIFFLFLQSSFFNCQEVVVQGNNLLSTEDIINTASIPVGNNLLYIDEKQIIKKLELLPMIESVSLEKRLPNSIYIFIKERNPAVIVAASGKFILVDRKGFYIQDVENIRDYKNIPIVTGIEITDYQSYGDLIEDTDIHTVIAIMDSIWEEYGQFFNEINIKNGSEDIIFYTYEGIAVKIGNLDNLVEKLSAFEKLYEKQKAEGTIVNIEYIDISFIGLPVIKYK